MKIITLLLLGLIPSIVQAQDHCTFNNPNELIEQISKTHPSILEAKLYNQAQEKLIDVSKQRPNPNFEAEGLFGNPNSQFSTDTFFSLQHTIELGGKRPARKKSAKMQIQQSKLQQRAVKEDVIVDTVIKLYQLRQVQELSNLYEETTDAFKKIRSRLLKLPAMSPQQQVEADTLELASNAYAFELIQVQAQENYIKKHLGYFLGCNSSDIAIPHPSQPTLPSSIDSLADIKQSVKVLDAVQTRDITLSKLDVENTKKTPNLSIGPALGYSQSQGSDSLLFGAALSMPLPLFNTNKGNRNYENANVQTATLALQNIEQEAKLDLELWKNQYQMYYQTLKSANPDKTLESKHQRIESLFLRGVVSTSLIIEAHRQLIEFRRAQFNFELGAIEALWNIYRLTGNLDKGSL